MEIPFLGNSEGDIIISAKATKRKKRFFAWFFNMISNMISMYVLLLKCQLKRQKKDRNYSIQLLDLYVSQYVKNCC